MAATQEILLNNIESILKADAGIIAALATPATQIQQQSKADLHGEQNLGNSPLYIISLAGTPTREYWADTNDLLSVDVKIEVYAKNFSTTDIDDMSALYDNEALIIAALRATPNLNTPTSIKCLDTWEYNTEYEVEGMHAKATITLNCGVVVARTGA